MNPFLKDKNTCGKHSGENQAYRHKSHDAVNTSGIKDHVLAATASQLADPEEQATPQLHWPSLSPSNLHPRNSLAGVEAIPHSYLSLFGAFLALTAVLSLAYKHGESPYLANTYQVQHVLMFHRNRVTSSLIWAAALAEMDVMTRIRRYGPVPFSFDCSISAEIAFGRRTSLDTSPLHHQPLASERRSARLLVPALLPNSPISTRRRDAS